MSRALERLREFFSGRNVTIGTAGLAALVSANAVQAAPAGLSAAISAAALLPGAAASASTAIAATKIIAMTTLQKITIAAAFVALAGTGIYEARQASQMREQNQVLQQQQAPLAAQIQKLQRERDDATNRLAALTEQLASARKNPSEVLKLRGEVGTLQQEKIIAGGKSALSKITANPETRKALRDQEKLGMASIYSDLAKNLKLTPEQTAQFNDLLTDHIMDGIDLITQALHDNRTRAEIDKLFASQQAALHDKLQTILGPDGLAQYLDYTQNLGSSLTVSQFGGNLTGDQQAVADKKSKLLQAMQEATQSALTSASLPADYQLVPTLHLANIASEDEATQSLQLLDNIYGQVADRATNFLDLGELAKFQEFRANAIKNNQATLLMNRKLMAPISQ